MPKRKRGQRNNRAAEEGVSLLALELKAAKTHHDDAFLALAGQAREAAQLIRELAMVWMEVDPSLTKYLLTIASGEQDRAKRWLDQCDHWDEWTAIPEILANCLDNCTDRARHSTALSTDLPRQLHGVPPRQWDRTVLNTSLEDASSLRLVALASLLTEVIKRLD